MVVQAGVEVLWTSDAGRTAWMSGTGRDGRQGLFSVNLATHVAKPAFLERVSILNGRNLGGSEKTGAIFFVSDGQDHKGDVYVFRLKDRSTHRVSVLNAAMADYRMGETRIMQWRDLEGNSLRGSLLLPPDYPTGRKLPLVVWVYGGMKGSEAANDFGLASDVPEFNMQVLATRGYAVLYPDAPVHTGSTSRDIFTSVMSGVDAVIAQGYADADRLAVMGTSYGSYSTFALITQTTRFKAAIVSAVTYQDFMMGYLTLGPKGETSEVGFYESYQSSLETWEAHRGCIEIDTSQTRRSGLLTRSSLLY